MWKYRWYCRHHLEEEKAAEAVPFTPFRCSVGGCQNPGVITRERKHFCTEHAPTNAEALRMVMNEPTGKSLEDVGRRYEHLTDLRDVWEEGLYTLSKIRPQYVSKADEILKESLTTAVSLLNKQIDSMAEIDRKFCEIRRLVDGK
jgi:hypothetical protein